MKIIHLSDLHIGKRVNEFPMIEDQAYILTKIINIIDEQKAETVLISGDVYDKAVPSGEAVTLFDDFLVRLSKRNLKVLIISGNHDSPERIAFGGKLMNSSGVYMSPVFNKDIKAITFEDEFGQINFYMLPFIKPVHVRAVFPDEKIQTYTDAIKVALDSLNIDKSKRNVLLTHQFVTGAMRSESEEVSVGGSDNVSGEVFDDFDYVALGHIHRPQKAGRETMRYCGSPLKYSFSEAKHNKSVTVVTFNDKDDIKIDTVPLAPKRDMVEIKGMYNEIMLKSYYEKLCTDDYFHITLTDEEDVPDALNKIRIIYKNIMKLDYDNTRTRTKSEVNVMEENKGKSPMELMADFYELQNGKSLSDEQGEFLYDLVEKVWEGKR